MRYHALACDYDGTLASGGRVDDATLEALERVRASGRRLLLVSGRQLDDLRSVLPRLDLFERAVLENGAVVHEPASGATRALCAPPPPAFVEALVARGVRPLSVGASVVATWKPHETAVLAAIRDLGLELQVTFNKGAVMVLPSGVNKASGLRVALEELGLSAHNAVGVGDAENDHAFFDLCECAVAVSNAVPTLRQRADWVTPSDHGAGVRELVARLLEDDLASLALARHALELGARGSEPVSVMAYDAPVLVAGSSGGGKSTLATSLLEQLSARGYQLCVVDPEGDHETLPGVVQLGNAKNAPGAAEVLEVLAHPGHHVVANLLALPLGERPAFLQSLLARLFELRARTGRPHWILVDEAHHLLPPELDVNKIALPAQPHGMLLVTVQPGSVSPALLSAVGTLVAVGEAPEETLAAFAAAARADPPPVPARPSAGDALSWRRPAPPAWFRPRAPASERRRHVRKYAEGELGPDVSFYFRGPEEKLNLRAQNLQVFLQLAEGVDDETWAFHLERGDYSRWFRERIKDEGLADDARAVESDRSLSASESRAALRRAVESRYTAPA